MDANYTADDIEPQSLERMIADCERFQRENADTLATLDAEQAGHDFWLTRNGHGCGFWDGDYQEPAASILTAASKRFGKCWITVGDDGHLYVD